jgi:hypothetical protein
VDDHVQARFDVSQHRACQVIGQAIGSLSETLHVHHDRPDPEVLINRVAGTNPELAAIG